MDDGDVIHVNRRGFRGAEIDPTTPDDVVRIVVLGGSQVFDWEGNWPRKLETELRRSGIESKVINAGVPGHDTADSLGKLLNDVWMLEPRVVILANCWNDLKCFSLIDPSDPYRGLPPARPESWQPDWRIYPTGLDAILSISALYRKQRWWLASFLYHEEGASRIPQGEIGSSSAGTDAWGVRQYRLNVEMMAEASRLIGAELVLLSQAKLLSPAATGPGQERAPDYGRRLTGLEPAELQAAFETCYEQLEQVAVGRGLRMIDMDAELSGVDEYYIDGIHFTEAGSHAAARVVSETIVPLLQTAGGVPARE